VSDHGPRLLRGYDEVFLDCRDLRHQWAVDGYYRTPEGQVHRDLTCGRCGTERTDRWDRASGDRLPSHYRYVGGYKVDSFDGERVGPNDVRLEVLRRVKVYASEEQMLAAMTDHTITTTKHQGASK
jgi:hypothetical protein